MDIKKIRDDFPLLKNELQGKPVIYFDNACQSLRPESVISAIVEYYREYPACAGRSNHKLGEMVTGKINEARETIAKFINAKKKEEIIFTRNTTEGINLVAHSFGLKIGDIVITTDKEHNSNLIPWQILTKKIGIIHKIVPSKEDNTFDLERFKEMMGEGVKLVSMVYTSNLDGVTLPVKEIIEISHEYGAKILLDAAQTAPHKKLDVIDLDVDFLAFSGHKMLGPSGIGVLYGKYQLLNELEPFLTGGETVEYSTYREHKLLLPPEKFEAGLQDYAGIMGFAQAVRYLEQVGFDQIAEQEYKLNKFITDEITKMSAVKIIGPKDPLLRGSIISFYIDGIDSHQIALMLNEASNIMIRSGQHCVHSWFDYNKIKSSARVSLYFYNTSKEAEIFIASLNKILKLL
jgi:cysteine desulfurase/selenocysteine lyase